MEGSYIPIDDKTNKSKFNRGAVHYSSQTAVRNNLIANLHTTNKLDKNYELLLEYLVNSVNI